MLRVRLLNGNSATRALAACEPLSSCSYELSVGKAWLGKLPLSSSVEALPAAAPSLLTNLYPCADITIASPSSILKSKATILPALTNSPIYLTIAQSNYCAKFASTWAISATLDIFNCFLTAFLSYSSKFFTAVILVACCINSDGTNLYWGATAEPDAPLSLRSFTNQPITGTSQIISAGPTDLAALKA